MKNSFHVLLMFTLMVLNTGCSSDVPLGAKIAEYHSSFTEHNQQLWEVAFSPDGTVLASAGVDKDVKIWRRQDGKVLHNLPHPYGVPAVAFSPDGKLVATGSYDTNIRLWNVDDGTLVSTFAGNTNTIWQLTFSPDGKTLASGGVDKIVRLWDVQSGEVQLLPTHEEDIWTIAFSPNGKLMASAGEGAVIKIWDVASRQLVKELTQHDWAVLALVFSPDGKTLASGGDDNTVRLWQTADWQVSASFSGGSNSIYGLVFSPDGQTLISAGRDKGALGEVLQYHASGMQQDNSDTIRIWDVSSKTFLQTLNRHSNDVRSLALTADGKWLASASEDQSVIIWSMSRWQAQ